MTTTGMTTALRIATAVRGRAPAAVADELCRGLGAVGVRCYTVGLDDGTAPVLVSVAGMDRSPDPVDLVALRAVPAEPVARLDPGLLDDGFAAAAGVGSIVGLAGSTPSGHGFRALVLVRGPMPDDDLRRLRPVAAALGAVLLSQPDDREYLTAVERAAEEQAVELDGLAATVDRLRAEAGLVDTLHAIGKRLTAQLDLDRMVQDATDAATTATSAAFGAFFYNLVDEYGESYTLYTLSGAPREAFERFPMPRNTAVFAPTFDGTGTVRSPDIVRDARFGHNSPYHGMPEGHLPVRSYLAVSAISPTSGEVLGGFFFGHAATGRFTERHAYLAEGIAGYAAIALDNARLFERERNLATELSRSMLPTVPAVAGLAVHTRYLPAATGIKVGGDWFDVIELAGGCTAFVIGDVVGHGVTAAAVMGQIRTAIRSYALLDLAPTDLLRNVSQLVATLSELGFATCFYAVYDPAADMLTYANAGHLPAVLIHPDGTVEQVGEALAQPLGIGTEFPQERTGFPPGTDLVLYTDGLVESHSRDLTVGMTALTAALPDLRAATDPDAACDVLIQRLTRGTHDDDIAFLHVHREKGSGPS